MASDRISVAIIGGGIGGLAAASSLLRVGIDVHVYEQARELTEVGAGIQISPMLRVSCIGSVSPTRWRMWA
jgi:2-polyprenyl-6-methoxyphenol hydroxylase-like FAD-dependent oxidoreductase